MTRKQLTALGAFASFAAAIHLANAGFPALPLYISLGASITAIALIAVEWTRV